MQIPTKPPASNIGKECNEIVRKSMERKQISQRRLASILRHRMHSCAESQQSDKEKTWGSHSVGEEGGGHSQQCINDAQGAVSIG